MYFGSKRILPQKTKTSKKKYENFIRKVFERYLAFSRALSSVKDERQSHITRLSTISSSCFELNRVKLLSTIISCKFRRFTPYLKANHLTMYQKPSTEQRQFHTSKEKNPLSKDNRISLLSAFIKCFREHLHASR